MDAFRIIWSMVCVSFDHIQPTVLEHNFKIQRHRLSIPATS